MHPDRFPELGDETSAYPFSRFLSIAPTPYDEEEVEFDPDQRNTASTMNSVQRQDLDARINAYHSSRFNSIASTESDREERESDHNEWEELESYDAALNLNRSFLRGERHRTIYHEGPPNDETRAMISGLLRLHDYGMLTHGSKPHDGESPVSVATWWIQTGQRSYVDFLIPRGGRITRGYVNLFCRLLVQHPKIVTLIDHNCEGLEPEMPESYALTRERVALTQGEVYMEPWKDIKWLRLNQHEIMR
jgi:hypothetical protein